MTLNIVFDYYIDPDLYFAITNLASPFNIDIPLAITNNEGITLYFEATLVNPPVDYSNYPQQLGSLAAGASGWFTFSPSRTTPTLTAGEFTESIKLRVNAYTDSGYTNLYGSQDLIMNITYIDYLDPAWTQIDVVNFDDGTRGGFATVSENIEAGYNAPLNAQSSTYYLSAPYSYGSTGGNYAQSSYKAYDTTPYTKVIAIVHSFIRLGGAKPLIMAKDQVTGDKKIVKSGGIPQPGSVWVRYTFPLYISTGSRLYLGCKSTSSSAEPVVDYDDIYIVGK